MSTKKVLGLVALGLVSVAYIVFVVALALHIGDYIQAIKDGAPIKIAIPFLAQIAIYAAIAVIAVVACIKSIKGADGVLARCAKVMASIAIGVLVYVVLVLVMYGGSFGDMAVTLIMYIAVAVLAILSRVLKGKVGLILGAIAAVLLLVAYFRDMLDASGLTLVLHIALVAATGIMCALHLLPLFGKAE